MTEPPASKAEAQRRADRIRAFREELEQLQQDGALELTDSQRARLARHHDELLGSLDERFDIDTTEAESRMSWGMRIVATLGATALAVAVYFFFYRFWGLMPTWLQVTLVTVAPPVLVAAAQVVSRVERTLYFTGLLCVLAQACFVLNLTALGTIFNITPSEKAFLVWGVFGLILAYTYGLRLLLAAGLVSSMIYLTFSVGMWSTCYWLFLGLRPENYLLAGAAAFAVPLAARRVHSRYDTFPAVYRLIGLLAMFIAVLILANLGQASYLVLDNDAIEILYQLVGFTLAGASIWLGIRQRWRETTNAGATFFVIFLYVKFFDWWWDLMPKYLFFLVLGLVAVGLLLILRRLRATLRTGTAKGSE